MPLPSISVMVTVCGTSAASPEPPALQAITRNLNASPGGIWVRVYSQIREGVVLHLIQAMDPTFCISIRYPSTLASPSSSGGLQARDTVDLVVSVILGFWGQPGGSREG